jgi:putative membrane protein insertion efficiency factor
MRARALRPRLDEAAIALIAAYRRFLSPFLPRACRFHPTCSEYCAEAIRRHGLWRGLRGGALRLLRCHPWSAGGYDPVR